MKKVFKFVKGKKDDRKEGGGITPSQSGDLVSLPPTPEDETFSKMENSTGGYEFDFSGKDKTLTKLHKAAWQGNLEKLKSALKKVEVDAVDRLNRTALHFAVVRGHPNIVWFLLGNNASTSICDNDGCTPLFKAIECGHKECFKLLLERGADINVADYCGNTCLHIAVKQGFLETIPALLNKGVNLEMSNIAGDYPLHIATKSERRDIIMMLLNAGAEVNVLDRENRTPLMLAARNGNNILIDLFIGRGATPTLVDLNGRRADEYALIHGHEIVASTLKVFIERKNSNERSIREDRRKGSMKLDESNPDESEESRLESESKKSEGSNKVEKKPNQVFRENETKEGNDLSGNEKEEETVTESPSAQIIPPYCQPPRSWDLIQAGMIGSNRHGTESKKSSLTALGTLKTCGEGFIEGAWSISPKHTLSLNRRKVKKTNNSFAKQRSSLNEEISLKNWIKDESRKHADDALAEMENYPETKESDFPQKKSEVSSDWGSDPDSDMARLERSSTKPNFPLSSSDWDSPEGDETLGGSDTMKDCQEILVNSSKTVIFPPPPSALELGVDMAKSWKYMKGISEDERCNDVERNLWKKAHETHSLDCSEGKEMIGADSSIDRHLRSKSTSPQRYSGPQILKCEKLTDEPIDVNKKINEQLECYDQALRELGESWSEKNTVRLNSQKTFYSPIPSSRIREGHFKKEDGDNGNILKSNKIASIEKSDSKEEVAMEEPRQFGVHGEVIKAESTDRKTKKEILMAMRDVRHAIQVSSSAHKMSFDDQILSPLSKPEFEFDILNQVSPIKCQVKPGSPANRTELFAPKRQETGMETKNSSSASDEEPTLWLENDLQRKMSQQNGAAEDSSRILKNGLHRRSSSFSPLGILFNEIQSESLNSTAEGIPYKMDDESKDGKSGHFYRKEETISEQNDEQKNIGRDPSPDVSLSSGPIEPLGIEKDSGSDPESSHNDITPNHHYTLKDQHEWLKRHLKAVAFEKNKLEEIAAQLSEKAERLQYELSDAKEVTKGKDEVIKLLQEQLSRMETAYTKSLEDSIQSRLHLTSLEQEILHLKELCYKYEGEKSKEIAETEIQRVEKLEMKVKRLEKEKEKLREEIVELETERKTLVKRLKDAAESEILDQCQRWKERGTIENEETTKEAHCEFNGSNNVVGERDMDRRIRLQEQRNADLENELAKVAAENLKLRSDYQRMREEMESKEKILISRRHIDESIEELHRKNLEMESYLHGLEKDFRNKIDEAMKEKRKEISNLMQQFDREKESLVEIYERKLAERNSEKCGEQECRREMERLKEMIRDLRDRMKVFENKRDLETELDEIKSQFNMVSKSLAERQTEDVNFLLDENLNLRDAIGKMKNHSSVMDSGEDFEDKFVHLANENIQMKNTILDLKRRMNHSRVAAESDCGRRTTIGPGNDAAREKYEPAERVSDIEETIPRSEIEKKQEIGLAGVRDRSQRSFKSKEDDPRRGSVEKIQKSEMVSNDTLELGKLKREMAFLRNKMANEKTWREALENQVNDISRDLRKKEIMRREIESLKKKINVDHVQKYNLELVEYQKELQVKRKSYLENDGDGETKKNGETFNDDYKAKCRILAREREKTKELLRSRIWEKKNLFDTSNRTYWEYVTHQDKQLKNYLSSCHVFSKASSGTLEPQMKNKLDEELLRSIRKHRGMSSSFPHANVETNEGRTTKSA